MSNHPHYFTADVVQYLMPDGRQVQSNTELPMATHTAYLEMQKHGCRLEAEMLTTGQISVTISNTKEEVDVDIELTPNGPDVQKGMIEMLNRRLWLEPIFEPNPALSNQPKHHEHPNNRT